MAGWKRRSKHDGVRPEYWRDGYQTRNDGWQRGTQGWRTSTSRKYNRSYQSSDRDYRGSGWHSNHRYRAGWQNSERQPDGNGYSNNFASQDDEYITVTSRILSLFNKTKEKAKKAHEHTKKAIKRGVSKECDTVKFNNALAFGEYDEAKCKVVEKP